LLREVKEFTMAGTGIPWERICVTGNMIARDGGDLPGVVESLKRTNDG
jgi:hypothetical protein